MVFLFVLLLFVGGVLGIYTGLHNDQVWGIILGGLATLIGGLILREGVDKRRRK